MGAGAATAVEDWVPRSQSLAILWISFSAFACLVNLVGLDVLRSRWAPRAGAGEDYVGDVEMVSFSLLYQRCEMLGSPTEGLHGGFLMATLGLNWWCARRASYDIPWTELMVCTEGFLWHPLDWIDGVHGGLLITSLGLKWWCARRGWVFILILE